MKEHAVPWESEPRVFDERHFYAVYDKFPVREGHLLIVSKRDIGSLFELTDDEFSNLRTALVKAKSHLDSTLGPDGYNVGVNDGVAAGQTVPRLHIHVIPRRRGDVANPRGGVRNFLSAMVPYDDHNE